MVFALMRCKFRRLTFAAAVGNVPIATWGTADHGGDSSAEEGAANLTFWCREGLTDVQQIEISCVALMYPCWRI